MKSIFAINPAVMENTECSIVKARAQLSIKIVGVSLNHDISYALFPAIFNTFGSIASKE